MTRCLTCGNRRWTLGTPDDFRDWIVPCPTCSPTDSLEQAAAHATQGGSKRTVAWSLATVANHTKGRIEYQSYPFFLRGDVTDGYYVYHHPSLEEACQLALAEILDTEPDQRKDGYADMALPEV